MTEKTIPVDVLAYVDARVRVTLEHVVDQIGGNPPTFYATPDELYDVNAATLDQLDALAAEIRELAARFAVTNYSDGRPIRTEVPIPGGTFVHLWHPDVDHDAQRTVRVRSGDTRTEVTITPPLTITTRTMSVVPEESA